MENDSLILITSHTKYTLQLLDANDFPEQQPRRRRKEGTAPPLHIIDDVLTDGYEWLNR